MSTPDTNDGRAAGGAVEAAQRRKRQARVAERIWWGTLSVMAALLLVAILIVGASARPESCVVCHQAEAKGVTASAHKGITCDDCHAAPTGFGLVESRLDVVNMAIAQVAPTGPAVTPVIDNKRCLLCHQKEMSKTVTVGTLKMNHAAVVADGWKCQTCHPNSGHPTASARATGYTMDMCMTCHSVNPKDTKSCLDCHVANAAVVSAPQPGTSKSPWRVTHGPNWQKTHGMGDLTTCKSCHGGTFCYQCHSLNVPHPEGYLGKHGQDVISRSDGRAHCLTCHKNGTACENCHGLPMPHPAGFLQQHSKQVKKSGDAVCLRCHDKSSCDTCHDRHIHPGLLDSVKKALLGNPVTGVATP